MQLTVLSLLSVAACAYAQAGAGFGVYKDVSLSLLPLFSIDAAKGFEIGVDTNNRRRRDAPARDSPKGPRFLVARRPGINFGDIFKAGPGAEDLDEAGANGEGPSRPKLGFGLLRHPLPPRFPFPPKRGHHGRKSTTTESSVESSSYSSSEANDESSTQPSSEASNHDSGEASNESGSQANNEANNGSSSNESSETSNEASNEASNDASNDASNESDSNSSNESSS